MKILYVTANRENFISVNCWDWLEKEVAKITDCKFAGIGRPAYKKNEPLDKTIKRLYGKDCPDWIIIYPTAMITKGKWKNFVAPRDRCYKIAAITSDIHCSTILGTGAEGLVDYLNKAKFDAVLMSYIKLGYAKKPFHQIDPDYFLKNLNPMIFYLKIWTNPTLFKPSSKSKIYDAVLLGAYSRKQHPLRYRIWKDLPILAKRYNWRILLRDRPHGIACDRYIPDYIKKGYIVGEKYAEVLGRSKIFLFGSSIYKYPLAKYLEGMACRTCVMADKPLTAKAFHFIPDENFVEVDIHDWKQKLRYYLGNDEERERIAQNGYETFMKYHTVKKRAEELVTFLEKNK